MKLIENLSNQLGGGTSAEFIERLCQSLLAKPFVIATGGSGTGKTALSTAVAAYFSAVSLKTSIEPNFRTGDIVGAGRADYKISEITINTLTLVNPNGSIIVFPVELVDEWIEAADSGIINDAMPQKEVRNAVRDISKFDAFYHGWTAQLMGLAFSGKRTGTSAVEQSTNSAVIAVGADWTDSRNVLGFVNHLRTVDDGRPVFQSTPVLDLILEASKPENSELPFFLILDEMNLSHVERYFADFLSVMEQHDGRLRLHSEGPEGDASFVLPRSQVEAENDQVGVPQQLPYPPNLFVVGTVNIDETTYMFSPKVLDRANVIEFTVESDAIDAFLKKPQEYPDVQKAADGVAKAFQALALQARCGELEELPQATADGARQHLVALFDLLKAGRFEFAYRTANEVMRYLRVCRHLQESDEARAAWDESGWRDDLDDQIVQKILPKLHGSVGRVGNLLASLATYCAGGSKQAAAAFFPQDGNLQAVPLLEKSLSNPASADKTHDEFPKSRDKLRTMIRVLLDEQFVSFIN